MTVSITTPKGKWILTAAILASGLGFLMSSAVNIALPVIQRSLHTDIAGVQWIANSYLLTLSAFILMSGSIADRVGVRVIFVTGIVVFTAGAALSGAVSALGGLIVFRALQGTGAALMVPSSLAVINSTFPRNERGRAVGLWAGISGAIAALGPFIGGFLADIHWRLVFLAVVPLGAVTLLVTLLHVPAAREQSENDSRRADGLDWPGTILAVIALGGLSFGLIRLPEQGASITVIAALAAGILGSAGFILRERKAPSPLVEPGLFNPTVTGANLATFALYFAFLGTLFLASFNLQQLQGYSPTLAGLAILPTTIFIAALSGPSGTITDRAGPRPQTIAGPLLTAAGFGLLLVTGYRTPYLPLYLAGFVLLGTGMAGVIPAVTSAALEVETGQSGTASGVNNAVARLAGLMAVVAAGGILHGVFASRLASGLSGIGLEERLVSSIVSRAGALLELELPAALNDQQAGAVRTIMRESFVAGYRYAMAVNLFMGLAASGVSALLIGRKKRRKAGSKAQHTGNTR